MSAPPLELRCITPELCVAGQIDPSDLPAIAEAGFGSVICNRPDGEQPDQPSWQAIEQAALQQGLRFAHLPVVGGLINAQQVQEFAHLLARLPGPILAYCRSGQRSTVLWAYSQARHQAWPELLEQAARAGYDLRALAPPPQG